MISYLFLGVFIVATVFNLIGAWKGLDKFSKISTASITQKLTRFAKK